MATDADFNDLICQLYEPAFGSDAHFNDLIGVHVMFLDGKGGGKIKKVYRSITNKIMLVLENDNRGGYDLIAPITEVTITSK